MQRKVRINPCFPFILVLYWYYRKGGSKLILNKEKILEEIIIRHEVPYKDIKQTDPCIVPLLILLNELGYGTKYSCQGHYDHEESYVMFKDKVGDEEIMILITSIQKEVNKKHCWWITSAWSFNKWTRAISENEFPSNYLLKIRGDTKKRMLTLVFLMNILFTLCFENTLLSTQKQKLRNYCKALIQELEVHLT